MVVFNGCFLILVCAGGLRAGQWPHPAMWPHTTTDFAVRKEMMGNAQLFGPRNMAAAAVAEGESIMRRAARMASIQLVELRLTAIFFENPCYFGWNPR
jgi:hypothetical protein